MFCWLTFCRRLRSVVVFESSLVECFCFADETRGFCVLSKKKEAKFSTKTEIEMMKKEIKKIVQNKKSFLCLSESRSTLLSSSYDGYTCIVSIFETR